MIRLKHILLEYSDDDFFEALHDTINNELTTFKILQKSGKKLKQPWKVFSYNKIKKQWEDFMKFGFVRNEKIIDEILSVFIQNILKLYTNTYLCGHTSSDPTEDFENYQFSESDKEIFWDEYVYHISDFATDKLLALAKEAYTKTLTAEQKLILADRMLQISHQRYDLSTMFIEGGKRSLDALFSGESRTNVQTY